MATVAQVIVAIRLIQIELSLLSHQFPSNNHSRDYCQKIEQIFSCLYPVKISIISVILIVPVITMNLLKKIYKKNKGKKSNNIKDPNKKKALSTVLKKKITSSSSKKVSYNKKIRRVNTTRDNKSYKSISTKPRSRSAPLISQGIKRISGVYEKIRISNIVKNKKCFVSNI